MEYTKSKEKRRILYLDLGPGFGGSVLSLASLLKTCRERNIISFVIMDHADSESLELIRCHAGKTLVTKQVYSNKRLDSCIKKVRSKLLRWLLVLFNIGVTIIANIPFYWRVVHFARKNKIDIVHFNNFFVVHAGIISILLHKCKCFCHVRICFQKSLLIKYFTSNINGFFAITNFVKSLLVEAGVDERKIKQIYNTIDFDFYGEGGFETKPIELSGEYKIGVFGCLLPWKGQNIFIEAAEIMLKSNSRWKSCNFYIVGSSPGETNEYERELRSTVDNKNLSDHVCFFGHRKDVARLMSEMDIVVHTSIEPEPLGRVIVEAMLLSKPVIATAMGGPLEYIKDGENGFLIQPNDPEMLSEKIKDVLSDKELCERVGVDAKILAEKNFSVTNNHKIIDCYYGLFDSKKE